MGRNHRLLGWQSRSCRNSQQMCKAVVAHLSLVAVDSRVRAPLLDGPSSSPKGFWDGPAQSGLRFSNCQEKSWRL